MNKKIVVTGIGTDVGKTVVSAILAEAMNGAYWKPIQAGDLMDSDRMKVENWTTTVKGLPEAFRLTHPISPHAAAELDGVEIHLKDLAVPQVKGPLVIEGAGGILVPMNSKGLTYVQVFQEWKLPVIVVSRHYLGSINHTLMTIEVLKKRGVEIEGIIFVGDENTATEQIILEITNLSMLARIPEAVELTPQFIQEQAKLIHGRFKNQ